ncbi:MAG TPA: hypothetical protein VGK77_08985 [Candidatus Binatia bacterium]
MRSYLRHRLRNLLNANQISRYLFQAADKQTICGIVIGTIADTEDRRNIIFDRIATELRLIQSYDGKRFAQIQRHIKSIFIFGDPTAHGYWHQELQMCELQEEFICAETTSVAQIACALVHEATHARLMHVGFGYEEPKRLRIEHICFDDERTFARRLPDEIELLKEIEETKSFYGPEHFSDAGRREAALEGLRTLGVPVWITWLLAKLTSDRSDTHAKEQQ